MFKSKEVPVEKVNIRKTISAGFNLIKIVDYEIRTASSGRQKISFMVEGVEDSRVSEPFSHKGTLFPELQSKGQVGVIAVDSYKFYNEANNATQLATDLKLIANAIGKGEEFDKIEASSVEDYMEKVTNTLMGNYFYCKAYGEESEKPGSKYPYINLSFGRFSVRQADKSNIWYVWACPVKSFLKFGRKEQVIEIHYTVGTDTLTSQFDINNSNHYKKLAPKPIMDMDDMGMNDVVDDLPF